MERLITLTTNAGLLLGLGIISFFTQNLITFVMLGTIMLMLFNIHIN
ncbi:MAG: hypothetical protein GX790_07030, partial [Syntrophomonadaceae bacterium]|nr:hypothetical protein [Syntrophomonadaceae bacterium]